MSSRVTGYPSFFFIILLDVDHVLRELKRHCRASGVHRVEIGEPEKAAGFEDLAVRFEALHNKHFGQPGEVAPASYKKMRDSQFSGRHKAEFRELLVAKVELRAINSYASNLDFGPWKVGYHNGDSADPQRRIRIRFRAAARKAAIAAGAPFRANLLDWWICKLARGQALPVVQGMIQLSAEYCEELESNALELKPLVDEVSTALGLSRDRYQCDPPVPYWLYSEPHRTLSDSEEEFKYWRTHIWESFAELVEDFANSPRRKWLVQEFSKRRWVYENGIKYARPNEDLRRRSRDQLDQRMELLSAWIRGLSYDVAVLQANYIIDRGLRAEDAMSAFERESAALAEKVQQSWRMSSKRLGLSWRKRENKGLDFDKPFREVSADLRELVFSALLIGKRSPDPAPRNSELGPDPAPRNSELGLAVQLNAAQISDPKLRKMYESVNRYQMYMKELRAIKVACKKYQTPDSLKKQFPDFEMWTILDKDDEVDIAKGAFTSGRFSWSLVQRLNSLEGKDDRTLKNYRRALKVAGIRL